MSPNCFWSLQSWGWWNRNIADQLSLLKWSLHLHLSENNLVGVWWQWWHNTEYWVSAVGRWVVGRAWKRSIRRFVITEKAPTRTAFIQEKTLVGAFSVTTNLRMDLFQALVVWGGWWLEGAWHCTSEPVARPLSAPSALWTPSALPFTPSWGFVASSRTWSYGLWILEITSSFQ